MTREEQLACLKDRPCGVCKHHTEDGCSKWSCVFDEEPKEIQISEIPDNITNGDVIKTLFPKAEVYLQEWEDFKSVVVWFENPRAAVDFTWDWWDAPYKVESEGRLVKVSQG